ncbi:MAG: flagellar hook-basal body complex protein FliE [Clostridiales bacterium]|nr:flagellar hook-basal body complex protein FliE [Clostridiales bacterium]MCF8021723.1 flagellar hook-basal body complex protein FliE [Clostridiales bacterium]
MSIDPIVSQPLTLPVSSRNEGDNKGQSFASMLNTAVGKLNQGQLQADQSVKEFLTGDAKNIHQVITAVDEAKFDMQLAVQVRNKMVESYQKIMQMNV